MQYYIFSDETGHWTHRGYYIRSWVLLTEETYLKLKGKMSIFKGAQNIKWELKFNENHDYSIFSDLDFEVYFTITLNQDFKDINYNLINHLNSQDQNLFVINDIDVRDRIISSVKNTLFLNIFEYHHLQNALNFFNDLHPNNNYNFIIDTPQYQNRHWTEMFRSLRPDDSFKLQIVSKSENFEGIQFADILAGNLNKIISNERITGDSLNSFEKKIVSNFNFGNPKEPFKNNPQIVMWNTEHQPLVDRLNILRERGGD